MPRTPRPRPGRASAFLALGLALACPLGSPREARAGGARNERPSAPAAGAPISFDGHARFRTWEYVLVPVLGVATVAAGLTMPGQERWVGRNGFDDAARNALRAGGAGGRRAAALTGDVLYYGLTVYPALVDSLLLAGLVHGEREVAWQTFMIYAESILTTSLITVATQGASGRARPMVDACQRDAGYDPMCENRQLYRSFFAGHVSMAFTGATLTCVTHAHVPLFGGGPAEVLACALPLAAATTVGIARITADKHWASDVAVGALVGAASGLALPLGLHYGRGEGGERRALVLAPMPVRGGALVGVSGGL